MFLSGGATSKSSLATVRVVVILIIASLAATLSPVQAEVAGDLARRALHSAFGPSRDTFGIAGRVKAQDFSADRAEDPSTNTGRVTHFRLCPRRLVQYVGETHTLVPLPLDSSNEVVQGVAGRWNADDHTVATVSSWGEVEAIAAGHTVVTVQAGTGRATVAVEVREGTRPVERDLEWDIEHAGNCNDTESRTSQSVDSSQEPIATHAGGRDALSRLAQPAALGGTSSPSNREMTLASHKIPLGTGTETDTVLYPSVSGGQLSIVTTTDTNTGFVSQVEYKNGATTLRKIVYTYVAGPDGGNQIGTVETFDEANASTKVEYGYESYGRMKNFYEYGYKDSGTEADRCAGS